jgi:hypothetical protein
VDTALKVVVGVIAALVILGIAALSVFTAQWFSSRPDNVAGVHDQDTKPKAAQPSSSMTPWPDLDGQTTPVPAANPLHLPSEQASSTSRPVVSDRAAQTRVPATHHRRSLYMYVPTHTKHHSARRVR